MITQHGTDGVDAEQADLDLSLLANDTKVYSPEESPALLVGSTEELVGIVIQSNLITCMHIYTFNLEGRTCRYNVLRYISV